MRPIIPPGGRRSLGRRLGHGVWGWLWMAVAPLVWGSVGISPMRVDVFAEPGGRPEVFALTITNTSDEPRTVALTVEEIRIGEQGELLFEPRLREEFGDRFQPYELSGASFLKLSEPSIFLQPKEQRSVRCQAQLPASARGEYYAVISANPGLATPIRTAGAQRELRIRFEVSVLVVLVAGVKHPPRYEGDPVTVTRATPPYYRVEMMELFTIFPKPTDSRQTLKMMGRFANRSNVHVLADISTVVRNVDEKRVVEQVPIAIGTRMVLPNMERSFVGEVASPLKPGLYQAQLEVNWGEATQTVRKMIQFEVVQPIAGVAAPTRRLGILGLASERVLITGSPGKVFRQDVTVTNQVDEQLIVEVRPALTGGTGNFSVAPSRFLIPAGSERAFQVRVALDRDAFADIREIPILLEPKRLDGERFPEAETRTLTVVLRVQPPPAIVPKK